jgi:hypothetical protein
MATRLRKSIGYHMLANMRAKVRIQNRSGNGGVAGSEGRSAIAMNFAEQTANSKLPFNIQ